MNNINMNIIDFNKGAEGGGGQGQIEIILTGDSGTLTAEQIADIVANKNIVLNNDGKVFILVNKELSLSYRTYINIDCALNDEIEAKAIYVQLDETAVNYGAWTLEDVEFKGSIFPIANTIPSGGMFPDIFYALGVITTDPNITIASVSDGKDHEYMLSFTIGTTAPASITFPASVVFPGTPSWDVNKHYEVSMKWDATTSKYYATVQSWDYESV